MAIFTRFKRKPAESTSVTRATVEPARIALSPEELRRELFAAAVAGDNQRLGLLGRQHREAIFSQRIIYTAIPAPIRANPALLRWYQDGLRAISECCAEWKNA